MVHRVESMFCMIIKLSPKWSCLHLNKCSLHASKYHIICKEFAASFGKSLPVFVSIANNFLEPIYVFLWRGSLGGWWKAFKPLCFEHQTACLKICSPREKWRAESGGSGGRERGEILTWGVPGKGVRWVILKFSWRAALLAQIRTNSKCHDSLKKEIKFDSEQDISDMLNEWFIFYFNEPLS